MQVEGKGEWVEADEDWITEPGSGIPAETAQLSREIRVSPVMFSVGEVSVDPKVPAWEKSQ